MTFPWSQESKVYSGIKIKINVYLLNMSILSTDPFSSFRMLTVNMDYTITLVLASALIIKYILFDNDVDRQMISRLEMERSERELNKMAVAGTSSNEVKVVESGEHGDRAVESEGEDVFVSLCAGGVRSLKGELTSKSTMGPFLLQ